MKCFYHSADLDGHCSGAIVKREFPECEMIGINYGQLFPWDSIKQNEKVFMVDFGLQPFEDMTRLNNLCELHWIDHHKTAIDSAHEAGFLSSGGQMLEIGKAGCELTWEYLYGPLETLPLAVFLLGRYDVWDHEGDERILPFQYGMRQYENTLPDNIAFWNLILNQSHETAQSIIQIGKTIIKYEDSQNAKFCKAYAYETEWLEHRIICANRGFTNSKLFDSVYDSKKHDFMLTYIWKQPKDHRGYWTVSMYSTRKDVDCGAIAKDHGGGGHKGAAGFQCDHLPAALQGRQK